MYTFLFLWKFSAPRAEISISIIYFLKHASLELLFRNCSESHHSQATTEIDILHCGDIEVINVGSCKNKVGKPLKAWRCLCFKPFKTFIRFLLNLPLPPWNKVNSLKHLYNNPTRLCCSVNLNQMNERIMFQNRADWQTGGLARIAIRNKKSNSVFGWCLQNPNHQNGIKTLNSSFGQTSS